MSDLTLRFESLKNQYQSLQPSLVEGKKTLISGAQRAQEQLGKAFEGTKSRMQTAIGTVSDKIEKFRGLSDFQKAIKAGNVADVEKLIRSGADVNIHFENGELPLHMAVCLCNEQLVDVLLKAGANPESVDIQNLSAIDHATLMRNEPILVKILGFKIGKDVKDVQETITHKGSASHVATLQVKLQNFQTLGAKTSGLHEAAFKGDISKLTQSKLAAVDFKVYDSAGLTPLHYAVLNNQMEAVKLLLDTGIKASEPTRDGDTPLHFAVLNGSPTMIQTLLGAGADVNATNKQGETALHYAATKSTLANVNQLIQAGATPYVQDSEGMSALALIGTSAMQRDPLNLATAQKAMFAGVLTYWLTQIAIEKEWIGPVEGVGVVLASAIVTHWSEFAILYNDLKASWKKTVAVVGMLTIGGLPIVGVPFSLWTTYHVALAAIEGFKTCWKNVGYRNWDVAKNAVVYSVNTLQSLSNTVDACVVSYQVFQVGRILYRMETASTPEEFDQAFREFQEFFGQDFKFNAEEPLRAGVDCPNITIDDMQGLSNVERIIMPELNPQCVEHAALILSPEFNWELFKQDGDKYLNTLFRPLAREVHPDKLGQDVASEAFRKIGFSREVLQAHAKAGFPEL